MAETIRKQPRVLELSYMEQGEGDSWEANPRAEHPIHVLTGRGSGNEGLEQLMLGRRPRVNKGTGGTLDPDLEQDGTSEPEGRIPKCSPCCVDPGLGTAPVEPELK